MCNHKAKGDPRTLQCNIFKCSICGNDYNLDNFDMKSSLPQMMRDRHFCFTCAFWTNKIESPDPNREIIDGQHYVFYPGPNSAYFQGFGGRTFYAIRNNGELITSNNVWHQGDIPSWFRDKLPDTAKFISARTFRKLRDNPFKCKSKGCWDRYHCFRYDISIEKEAGPWNVVPKNHVVGQEDCESFINKDNL